LTEIQFLLKLLLEHNLEGDIRTALLTRIGEVEASFRSGLVQSAQVRSTVQVPSTQALLDNSSQPVAQGTQLGQAAKDALAHRQSLIDASIKSPAPKGPRKF